MYCREKIFLWPKSKFRFSGTTKVPSVEIIEKRILDLWPETFPVIFSSARNGIRCILKSHNVGRHDIFYLPKYSSHCLFETVARDCCPNSDPQSNQSLAGMLHYYQWGIKCTAPDIQCDLKILDMADSLPNIGRKFPTTYEFSVVSLPKILGNLFGGVVFCGSKLHAERLRNIRNKSKHPYFNSCLRIAGQKSDKMYKLWHGNESNYLGLNSIILKDIWRKAVNIEHIIKERLALQKEIIKNLGLEGKINNESLLSNLPLIISKTDAKTAKLLNNKISSGERMFFSNEIGWVKCWPFPMHDKNILELSTKLYGKCEIIKV